jgi:hypothetical protein
MLQPLRADEVTAFCTALHSAFLQAVDRQPLHRLVCDIGGVRIGLDMAGTVLAEAVRPAFSGILVDDDLPVDVTLRVFDSKGSGVDIPTFPRPMQALIGWRGQCAAEPGVRPMVFFDHGSCAPFVVDTATSTGTVTIDDLTQLPYWMLAAPFRSELGVLLQPYGIQLVHGAAVGRPEGAVLLTGYGGSGKSTTALSCLRRGLTVLGDDYVAIKVPARRGTPATVHRVYSSLKLHPHEVDAPPAVKTAGEKIVLFPDSHTGDATIRSAPCLGFWSVGLAPVADTWCEPRHPEDVARIATASTGLQIPGDDQDAARIIRTCAEASLTTQHLWLGSDRAGVVDVIERYLGHPLLPSPTAATPVWKRPDALLPISVIVPVYNGTRFIAEALRNIASQGYDPLEIIVVDDGSTDDLGEVLGTVDVPHRLVRQDNRGPAAARNRGIREATGAWIAFQDVDDLWPQGALLRLAQDLALHAAAPVVHGKIATIYDRGPGEPWGILAAYAETFPYSIHAGLYRRDVFDRVGMFDESLRYGEDMEWFLRLRTQEHSVMIPEVIVQRRRHDLNMTNDALALSVGSRDAWKKILLHGARVRLKR